MLHKFKISKAIFVLMVCSVVASLSAMQYRVTNQETKLLFDLVGKAKKDNPKAVQKLLTKGASVNSANEDGYTPLHLAVSQGLIEIATLLVKHGARLEARDIIYGYTPLHWATNGGNSDLARQLIQAGAPLDLGDNNGCTPLHKAIEQGTQEIVNLMLAKGACVDALDNKDETPLHKAAERNDFSLVTLLVQHGAQVDVCNAHKVTPLMYAQVNESQEMIALFSSWLNMRRRKRIAKVAVGGVGLALVTGAVFYGIKWLRS